MALCPVVPTQALIVLDHEKERLIKCRKWLHPLQDPDAELNSNLNNKTEGTCTWIQNTEEFGLAIEGDEQKHLWIKGKPGIPLRGDFMCFARDCLTDRLSGFLS